jgi:hypothetical protein
MQPHYHVKTPSPANPYPFSPATPNPLASAHPICYDLSRERKYSVKSKLSPFSLGILALFTFFVGSIRSQTVVTFDNLSESGSGAFFGYGSGALAPQGYAGLIWSNILCNNAILETNILAHIGGSSITSNGLTGDFYGMVSPSNVADMVSNCEIDSPGSNFNFLSAYFTGFLNSNLNIEVEGFNGTNLIYDQTVVASATNPTLFTFNDLDINRLYFNSFGGQPAFGGLETGSNGEFIMDNFEFEFIPEPSSFLLAALGCISLVALVRHRSRASGKPADGGFLRRKRM